MADPWEVILERDAEKMLGKLPRDLRDRIARELDGLAQDPRPTGCKRLRGYKDLWRLRVGDWRITYAIFDDKLIVLVIEIAARGGAYKDL